MSSWLRSSGIILFLLASIALHGIGHQDLFWLCVGLGIVFLMLCGHIHKHLLLAAKARHEQIRDQATPLGIPQQDLDNFNQLPLRITAQDYKLVPAKLTYLAHALLIAGILLLISAIVFRTFPLKDQCHEKQLTADAYLPSLPT